MVNLLDRQHQQYPSGYRLLSGPAGMESPHGGGVQTFLLSAEDAFQLGVQVRRVDIAVDAVHRAVVLVPNLRLAGVVVE